MNFVWLAVAAVPYLATWLLLDTLTPGVDRSTPDGAAGGINVEAQEVKIPSKGE